MQMSVKNKGAKHFISIMNSEFITTDIFNCH